MATIHPQMTNPPKFSGTVTPACKKCGNTGAATQWRPKEDVLDNIGNLMNFADVGLTDPLAFDWLLRVCNGCGVSRPERCADAGTNNLI